MKNIKIASVHALALATLFFCGSETAYGQGVERRHKLAAAPAAAAAAAPAVPNPDCTIIIPVNPLTAKGLSTPFLLTATDPANGPCNETNVNQSAFVQAAILDPATGQISTYAPLVIDKGTQPAAAPVVPTLPANAVVALWFGYNGNNLTQQSAVAGDDLRDNRCVNGEDNTLFGQFSYCNAPHFFHMAQAAINKGQVTIPSLGTSPKDGKTCPTVRDFSIVDQDQSDNLPVSYLITAAGLLAQNTQANLAAFPGATKLGNPSDNRLLDVAVDGALGCTPWKVPDLADPGQTLPALPLNELQARALQSTPVALIPAGDPMAQVNGNTDIDKVNHYRRGVDQPLADSHFDVDTARYCRQMLRVAPTKFLLDQSIFLAAGSPAPDMANSLFTFLAQRFVASYQILNCQNLIKLDVPISVTTDANGVATSATINTMLLSQEVQDLAARKAADDAADSAARSQQAVE